MDSRKSPEPPTHWDCLLIYHIHRQMLQSILADVTCILTMDKSALKSVLLVSAAESKNPQWREVRRRWRQTGSPCLLSTHLRSVDWWKATRCAGDFILSPGTYKQATCGNLHAFYFLSLHVITSARVVRFCYCTFSSSLQPNTHRRRRDDETVEFRRVGGVNTIRN